MKKLLLIGAVPQAPENYSNIKTILEELDIGALEFTISADVKLCKLKKRKKDKKDISVLILVGKSLGKPTFGCPFCSARIPFTEDGVLYTLADLLALHEVIVKTQRNST